MSTQQPPNTTTDAGMPVPSDEYSLTVGPDGPVLLQDTYLIEKLAHFVRERVPDRVYHVKGGGAFGYFEVTADVTQWTKAAFLNKVGKRTPLFLRFSIVAGEEGSPDTERDVRGFAIKFYTEEGNYDLVGNNTPIFFVRDPMKFPDFIHSQKRLPDTGMRSNNMQWDFWTLSPESAHQVTYLMSDRGTPRTWRHMNGYGSHTYMWENAAGEKFWVKYHFKTEQGVQNFTDAEARAMFAEDLDYHRRDLWEAIARKDYPAWRAGDADHALRGRGQLPLQPLRPDQGLAARGLPADPDRPAGARPQPGELLRPGHAGRRSRWRTLSRASGPARTGWCWGGCSPTPTRTAIATAPTTMQLPVNRPSTRCTTTTRTARCATATRGNQPVYAPNSYGGPQGDPQRYRDPSWFVEAAEIMRTAYVAHRDDDDFIQPGTLYRQVLTPTDRDHLVGNIVGHLSQGVERFIQERAVNDYWAKVDADLGARVAQGLGLSAPQPAGTR